MTNPNSILKRRHCFVNKGPCSQGNGFSSGHVWMWELDCKENWAPKNPWFWTMLLDKTLESPLDTKKIQPVHPKGDQSWVFIGRSDVKGETPILWPPDVSNWRLRKNFDARKDWRQRRRGWQRMTWLDSITNSMAIVEISPYISPLYGDSEGQGSLACYSSWGCKESDKT